MTTAGSAVDDTDLLPLREIEHYRDEGYIVVENVLDEKTLAHARTALAELVEGARAVSAHTDIYDLEPTHRPDSPRVRRIKSPHLLSPFDEIMRSPKILRIVAQLIGPAIRFHHSKLNLKGAHGGSPIEWHQDWAFYPHTNEDLLAVSILLEDCHPDNGPMMVIPRSHRGTVYSHHSGGVFCGAIAPSDLNETHGDAVALTGKAGTTSFHHVRLVHGSAQNRSSRPRPLLLYVYKAADAWPLLGVNDLTSFDAELLSGKPSIEPRVEKVPVRMPLPRPPGEGSIYERQASAQSRFFDIELSKH